MVYGAYTPEHENQTTSSSKNLIFLPVAYDAVDTLTFEILYVVEFGIVGTPTKQR